MIGLEKNGHVTRVVQGHKCCSCNIQRHSKNSLIVKSNSFGSTWMLVLSLDLVADLAYIDLSPPVCSLPLKG